MQSQTKSVNTKMTGAVIIIKSPFKIFISFPPCSVLGIFSTHIIWYGQAKDKDTDKKKKRREEQRSNAVPPSANGVSIPVMKVWKVG